MTLYDMYGGRLSRTANYFIYHPDERDSGCPSWSSSPEFFEDEIKNELARSEKRRSALHQSLRNAHHALKHQKDCLQQQENDIVNSDVTIEHLLLRQELLESRFSSLKCNNLCPGSISQDIAQIKQQRFDYLPATIDSSRITDLERQINELKMKMRRYSSFKENNCYGWNYFEERKNKEAEMQEELRQHAEYMEAKCRNAQCEREALEVENTTLHSGLHQAKVTSKELEKECLKLRSQIVANRNINESLHLEVSDLKKHSHTLENAVEASVNENKSLHSKIENLQQENQSLCSQKELLFSIMRKKGKMKHHYEDQSKRTFRENQIYKHKENNCGNPIDGSLLFGSSCDSVLTNSRRPRKLKRKKKVKCESKDNDGKHGDKAQMDCGSKRSEMNTRIILACCQHLSDLLRKLESLLKSNAKLDKEKEHIYKLLLGTVKELKDGNISNDKSREQVEELLNERNDLQENFHMRLNQITAVLIELKHLRQACDGILKSSWDPDYRNAMVWISRVQALKDSLKLLKFHEQVTESNLEDVFKKNHAETYEHLLKAH